MSKLNDACVLNLQLNLSNVVESGKECTDNGRLTAEQHGTALCMSKSNDAGVQLDLSDVVKSGKKCEQHGTALSYLPYHLWAKIFQEARYTHGGHFWDSCVT